VAAEPLKASVVVAAEPAEVWEHFTRAEAMVTWMGHYALLDARPDGEFAIDVNESQIRGRFEELDPPTRLVVSWGFAGSRELPPGTSTVEVRLTKVDEGTRVDVLHHGLPPVERDKHEHGWRHFLGRLADTRRAAATQRAV
jgi:uncharacterized protein YndB with AHSA1/START domain